jgi:hypothetical protein
MLIVSLDAQVQSMPVRLLPYALIPGMVLSSPLFLKAISVISKQQAFAPTGSANTLALIDSSSKGKKKNKSGMFQFIFYSLEST